MCVCFVRYACEKRGLVLCRYLYWSVAGPRAQIVQSLLDGSNQTAIVSSGISSPAALSLDISTGDIYWTDVNVDSIQVCCPVDFPVLMAAASPFIVDRLAQRAFHASVHCWWLRFSCGCSTCVEQFAGHCHIVAIAADIQETNQDGTVCSQLSRLLAAATSDTCFFFSLSFRIARTSLFRSFL